MKRLFLMSLALFFSLTAPVFAQDRGKLEKEIEALRNQLREKEEQFISVSEEDRAKFADFLKQPDTGLIRLLPREKYNDKTMIRGGGAYYSFTRLSHEYGAGSDIQFEQGRLSVGFAGANFGFICDIGSTPIEQITLDHPLLNFSLTFAAPTTEPEARHHQRLTSAGFNATGLDYRRDAVAFEGRAYILRSIDYETSDVLVAFRVIREDSDGSVTLLWKRLKKFSTPRLERH
ncbi:MAG: hypothetical protein AB1631_18745 [Acidobacteriota bacterium]